MAELTDLDKQRAVQRFYAAAGPYRSQLGARPFFDRSEHREVILEGNSCVAFIEGKLNPSKTNVILNIGMMPKYHNLQIFSSLIDSMAQEPRFANIKSIITSVHVADTDLEQFLIAVGFERITDRAVILNNKLPVDGLHISYHK